MAESNITRRMPDCLEHCSESHLGICASCGRETQVGLVDGVELVGPSCLRCISGDPEAPATDEWAAHEGDCPNYVADPEEQHHHARGATMRLEDGTEFELSNAQLGTICAGLMLAIGSAHLDPPQRIGRGFHAAKTMHERMGSAECKDLVRKFKAVLDAAFPDMVQHRRADQMSSEGVLEMLQKIMGPDVEIIEVGRMSSKGPPFPPTKGPVS